MKVLTRKDQDAIALHLAVIYNCSSLLAVNLNFAKEDERACIDRLATALVDLAHIAGGFKMVRLVPAIADQMRSPEQEETEGEE